MQTTTDQGQTLNLDPDRVKRVLIYRLGSLGDTVVALPALHLVERTFPNARRILLTNIPVHAKAPPASAVLDGSGLVHGYIRYSMATRNPVELMRLWWNIRGFRPEVLVYLTGSRGERAMRRDEDFFRACGVHRIYGVPRGDLETCRLDEGSGIWEHEASRLMRCLRSFGTLDVFDLRHWDLRLTVEEKRKAEQVLEPLQGTPRIACGPGTKVQAKDWGEDRWRALLDRLSREFPGYALVLVGAKEDERVSDAAGAGWQGPTLNTCGQLTPREAAAVLRTAELFLGPDSGPMHLAAAQGVPCAIPFAALDRPGHWFPIGPVHRPIYHHVDCENCGVVVCVEQRKKCLTSIAVDEMLAAALQAWQGGQRSRIR